MGAKLSKNKQGQNNVTRPFASDSGPSQNGLNTEKPTGPFFNKSNQLSTKPASSNNLKAQASKDSELDLNDLPRDTKGSAKLVAAIEDVNSKLNLVNKSQTNRDSFVDEDGNDLVDEVKRRKALRTEIDKITDSLPSRKETTKKNLPITKRLSQFSLENNDLPNNRAPSRAKSDVQDLSMLREKMINDLYRLSEIENNQSLRIMDKKRRLAVENMKLNDALIVNESLSSFDSDGNAKNALVLPGARKLNDFKSQYPQVITKFTKNAKSFKVEPVDQMIRFPKTESINSDSLDLFLETTDKLIDQEGHVFAENQSVRYVGKALFNPGENPGVSLIQYKAPNKVMKSLTNNNNSTDENLSQNEIDLIYSRDLQHRSVDRFSDNTLDRKFQVAKMGTNNYDDHFKTPGVNYQTSASYNYGNSSGGGYQFNSQPADLKKLYGIADDDKVTVKPFYSAPNVYEKKFNNDVKRNDFNYNYEQDLKFKQEAERVLKQFDNFNQQEEKIYSENFGANKKKSKVKYNSAVEYMNGDVERVSRRDADLYAIDDPSLVGRAKSKTNLKKLASKKDGDQLVKVRDEDIWDPGFYELEEEEAYREKLSRNNFSNFTKVEWG